MAEYGCRSLGGQLKMLELIEKHMQYGETMSYLVAFHLVYINPFVWQNICTNNSDCLGELDSHQKHKSQQLGDHGESSQLFLSHWLGGWRLSNLVVVNL